MLSLVRLVVIALVASFGTASGALASTSKSALRAPGQSRAACVGERRAEARGTRRENLSVATTSASGCSHSASGSEAAGLRCTSDPETCRMARTAGAIAGAIDGTATAGGMLAASMVPGVGEAMDAELLLDGDARWWMRGVAAMSLVASVVTMGGSPNVSAVRQIDNAASAATTVGRRGQQVVFPNPRAPVPRNAPTSIGAREYSGHALDRMQERGFVPSVIESAISGGKSIPGSVAGTIESIDAVNKVKVITDAVTGRVITVF